MLKDKGWLVIYANNFAAMMTENPEFQPFIKQVYFARYPTPKRHHEPLTSKVSTTFSFSLVSEEKYSNEIIFTVESLVNYLMTQTNVIAKVEQGTETIEEAHAWLTEQTKDLLPNGQGTFPLKGDIVYVQKEGK